MSTSSGKAVKVLATQHTGITVRSLEASLHVFTEILGLHLQRRGHVSPPVSAIVGDAEAEIDFAIVELPGGHVVELLEYAAGAGSGNRAEHRPRSWELGSWHLCLTVASIDDAVRALSDATWHGSSLGWATLSEPQLLSAGPNAGMRLCYVRDADGFTLELFEPAAT